MVDEALQELALAVLRLAAAAQLNEIVGLLGAVGSDPGVQEGNRDGHVERRLGEATAVVVVGVGDGLYVEDH